MSRRKVVREQHRLPGKNEAIHLRDWVVPALVAAVQAIRLIYIDRMADLKLIQYIPDDAFYYLTMGRNFARMGRWTFDGVEPSTGFHLLWGYLIAAMYSVVPSIGLHAAFAAMGVVQIACVTIAAWVACRTAVRLFGQGAQAGVALVFLSALSLVVGISLMETAAELLVAAAVADLLCRADSEAPCGVATGIALGFIGTMARSDFGLLPLVLFAMQWTLWRRGASGPRMMRLAGAVLGGAMAGTIALALHVHWISGEWVQASARQKLFWSQTGGLSIAPARRLVVRLFNVAENGGDLSHTMERFMGAVSLLLLALLAIGLSLALLHRHVPDRTRKMRWAAAAAMCCVIAGYLAVYRFDTEIQNWYIGNFEVPVALLAGGAVSWFWRRQRLATIAVAALLCIGQISLSFRAPLPWQDVLYMGGVYLHDHPEAKPVGSWNAGLIGYFADGGVTNIDGLVNDRIFPYTQTGTLSRYVKARGLRSLMDYNVMFWPAYAKRGGYADGSLQRCLAEDDVLAGQPGVPPSNAVRLYRMKPECRLKP